MGLTSGKEQDVRQNSIVVKAPLAAVFGTTLEVLFDCNVNKLYSSISPVNSIEFYGRQ